MCADVRLVEECMTIAAPQAAKLKRLAQAAYDADAFKPNLTGAEADLRIAALIAKLKVLDGRAIELWKLQPKTPRFR